MKTTENKNLYNLIDLYILTILIIVKLVLDSFKTLVQIFSYGFLKKEILTKKSNLGFDIKIKM